MGGIYALRSVSAIIGESPRFANIAAEHAPQRHLAQMRRSARLVQGSG
jgi:hypothetical protein